MQSGGHGNGLCWHHSGSWECPAAGSSMRPDAGMNVFPSGSCQLPFKLRECMFPMAWGQSMPEQNWGVGREGSLGETRTKAIVVNNVCGNVRTVKNGKESKCRRKPKCPFCHTGDTGTREVSHSVLTPQELCEASHLWCLFCLRVLRQVQSLPSNKQGEAVP